MKFRQVLWLLAVLFSLAYAQDTSDCGSTFGCLRFPDSCSNTECNFLVKWQASGTAGATTYTYYVKIDRIPTTDFWAGIAFSSDNLMGEDNAFICQYTQDYTTNSLLNYYNSPLPTLVQTTGTVGVASASVTLTGSAIMCQFDRTDTLPAVPTHFNTVDNSFYMLVAYGPLGFGAITWHSDKVISKNKIDFNALTDNGAKRDIGLVKGHATIMILAWLLFASTGILVMRYYKQTLDETMLLGKALFFVLHRGLLTLALVMSIAGFLMIFITYHYYWVKANANWSNRAYAHSLFGANCVVLSAVQFIMGMFRCHTDSPHRFIYNKMHRLVGITSYVSAITAIYIGTESHRFDMGHTGWALVLGWNIWLIVVICVLEVVKRKFPDAEKGDESEKSRLSARLPPRNSEGEERNDDVAVNTNKGKMIRKVILLVWFVVATIMTLALIFVINLST